MAFFITDMWLALAAIYSMIRSEKIAVQELAGKLGRIPSIVVNSAIFLSFALFAAPRTALPRGTHAGRRTMRTAVIAGTPVDTQMGVDFLEGKGVEAAGFPAAATAQEQVLLQICPWEERERKIEGILGRIQEMGIQDVMVYCNSLSSVIDAEGLAARYGLHITTPMDAYKRLGARYRKLGVMAGSSQGLAGIEKSIMGISPETAVLGMVSLPLTQGIEAGISPKTLVETNGLRELMGFFEKNRTEALILGCTHFPCLMGELAKLTGLPIIDPAETIYEIMREKAKRAEAPLCPADNGN